ncbi:hypothetical protein JAAARDRAFT_60652 [Jaapia argillacea MUCL 33604]|uniref:Uncharacterized protein n=1 Tax=Jaapia argillacea MUCL 33604 TaxID=933084 RepID=A0A067PHD6_9AGAM|nr:hypothetical protein JAAARDRAFT_60652 [Jaapia argillacea MUCL 33604]
MEFTQRSHSSTPPFNTPVHHHIVSRSRGEPHPEFMRLMISNHGYDRVTIQTELSYDKQ